MISLVSEMTDRKGPSARGWLFFDAECAFCMRIARWLAGPMSRRGLRVAALQDPRVVALFGLSREELLGAVRFMFADGSHCSGADALLAVANELWWARPLILLAKFPGVLPFLRWGYDGARIAGTAMENTAFTATWRPASIGNSEPIMEVTFDELWKPSGTIDRGSYALIGLIGFAIKHNLDRLLATWVFQRPWTLFNYLEPVQDVGRITQLGGDEAAFLATMVALALPFIWIGVVLTLKRLRSAGLPPWLVILFFIPLLNLFFFVFLSLVPAYDTTGGENERGGVTSSWLARVVPESALGSAAVSLLVTVPLGLALVALSAQVLASYGWGVFVALPFTMGFAAAMIYGIRQPRSQKGCVGVACLSVALLGGALLALAFEGLACLVMALPLALPLAAGGGVAAYWARRLRRVKGDATAFLGIALLFVPGVEWTEHVTALPEPTFAVRSAVDIHASPEKVWKQVIAFSEIGPPTELIFRAGVAYPIRAEMIGTGVGAERHCVFSTGAFIEPIEVWDEPHRLKFSVTSNPPPMQEWTPYSHIDTPHLHGFLVSNGGQFLLTPLPDGGTRLEGTTWYRHGLWPSQYWRVWSDAIIHRIHMRVLEHIREEAEKPSRDR